jgi:thiamine biosynthesis lipoprotein
MPSLPASGARSPHLRRRRFIWATVGAVGVAGIGSLGGIVVGGRPRRDLTTRTGWALGSDVSICVAGLAPEQANRAIDAAFAELESIEQVMSLYRPDSQICRLNREGVLDNPHSYLVEVLRQAAEASAQSQGAFDITVQPLWELYASAKRAGQLPEESSVALARERIDWRRVEVRDRQIRLRGNGTAITLNGIAQGFATDRVQAVLRMHGVKHALINAGEVGSLGVKAEGDRWTAGIQHPRQADAYVSLAELDGRSLATSGDYETTFSPDFRKNHIFDPRTGDSPTELASAVIVAPTACQADALSTAAMVLGTEGTLRLVERLPHVDALLVRKDGRVLTTPGFPQRPPAV